MQWSHLLAASLLGLSFAEPHHPHKRCDDEPKPMAKHVPGYRSVAYYVDWAIYARQHFPVDLPVEDLTHVLFAFGKNNITTGLVGLADPWADAQIQLKNLTDPHLDASAKNVYGCIQQLNLLKQRNRNLKVLLSIGGFTYSQGLNGTMTDDHINNFATSAVDLVNEYGFDGIDIDWEFPVDKTDSAAFVKLLKEIRTGLDKSSSAYAPDHKFEISAAVSAGPTHYEVYDLKGMDQYLDFWNLMAYDYAGPWDLNQTKTSGHSSNIFPDKDNANITKFSTSVAMEYYLKTISPSKMNLLMPLYGHIFDGTKGPGLPFTSAGAVNDTEKEWEAGSIDLSVLPLPGAVEKYDKNLIAGWSYDSATQEMISYDTDETASDKVKWVKKMKLGGVGFWESSGDKKGSQSRIKKVVSDLGGSSKLQQQQNWLDYTQSPFANLRNGKEYTGTNNSTSTTKRGLQVPHDNHFLQHAKRTLRAYPKRHAH